MSDFERWKEVKVILQAALDLPEGDRTPYLDAACGSDATLRREVEALLAVSSTRADFFDNFQIVPKSLQTLTLTEGQVIDSYRIIRPIGKGGMGAVYLAQDNKHKRNVALKVLPRTSKETLQKEEQLLASLQHANIATLYDSGQTDTGFGYFIMEYIEGEPITSYCDACEASLEKRLEIFIVVCNAVAFAHRNLIVHRDIKPANILVTKDGVPKLLDFGIAKLLPHGPSLEPETVAYTEAFASPEQLSGEKTTTATDIYSLGVLLCLLLTGRLPYAVKNYKDLPWAIRHMQAEKPSQLVLKEGLGPDVRPISTHQKHTRKYSRQLEGDLDAIVLHALRKDTNERFETVVELAEDIRRHLAIRPVIARPPTLWYRTAKLVKRRAAIVSIAGIFGIVILVLLLSLLGQYRRAISGEAKATREAERAYQINRFVIKIFERTDPFGQGEAANISVDELLDQSAELTVNSLNNHPDLKASVLSVLGAIFNSRGKPNQGQAFLEDALVLQRRGPRDRALAETLFRYGDVLTSQGDFQAADAALEEANEILNNLEGSLDVTLLVGILVAQAASKIHQADYDAAQQFSDAALVALRGSKTNLPALVNSLHSLGRILGIKGRNSEAEAIYRRALEFADQIPHEGNLDGAAVANSLGALLAERGDYSGAREMYMRSLEATSASLGAESVMYAMTLNNFVSLESDLGNFKEALAKSYEVVSILEKQLPPTHHRVLTAWNMQATILGELREFERAEEILLKVLAGNKAIYSNPHPAVAGAFNNLAVVCKEQGRFREAEDYFRQALEIFEALVGRNSAPVATLLGNMGVCAEERGDTHSAEARYEEALTVARQVSGGRSPVTVVALSNLGLWYISRGELEKARELTNESTSLAESVVGPTAWLTGYTYYMDAKLLLVEGESRGGLARARQAQAIFAATLPSEDMRIAITDSVLGDALGRVGDKEAAEKLLLDSLARIRSLKGDRFRGTSEARERVRTFYQRLGQNDEAAKYR